ncbi:MAG TPA: T9SS type A sorting domain-containing protein [Ferruginibacter sp.]|nr:T9SS type A sorting domain-containing protein [Ferruginibacter sp.]HPH89220.1 T9SS type A sorting domain-containing protein [Ferruginibacter sp.]
MKRFLLLIFFGASNLAANAQAGGYLFSQQAGAYTPVTGTVILSNCTNNNLNTDTSSLVTLPQAFTFSDTVYSTIRVGKGGWITFGNSNPLNADPDFYKAGFVNTHGSGGIIRALSLEWLTPSNGATPCSTNVQTAVVGNEFVVQWTDFKYEVRPVGFGFMRFWHINVQVRLNFSDNSIKIVYGNFELSDCSPPPFATVCEGANVSVGISSIGANEIEILNARQVPKGAGLNSLNPVPFTQSTRGNGCYIHDERSIPAGTTFTWIPGQLFPPSSYKAAPIEATTGTIKFNRIAAADAYEYNVRKAESNQTWPETGNIITDTTITLTGLQPDTVYQIAIRSRNGSYVSAWRYFSNTFTTPCGTATIPYVADFTDAACMKVIRDSTTGIGWGGGSLTNEFAYAANPVGSWLFSKRLPLDAGTTYRIYFKYSGNTFGSRTLDNNLKVQMSLGYNDTLNLVSSPVLNVPLLFAQNGRIDLDTFMLFTPTVTAVYTVAFFARASRQLGLVQVTSLEVFDNAVMNTIACPTLLSPANNSVLPLFNNISLNWSAVSKATKYYYAVSDSAYYGNLTTFDESETLGLSSLFVYTGGPEGNRSDWYVVPRVYGSRINGCSTNVRTYRFENPPAPVNDLCSNAISLPVSNGFCTQPQKGSLIKSTFSNNSDTVGNCMPFHAEPGDVWYKITIPATGNTVLQLSRYNNNTATNMSMMAFSGSCGSLTRIACAFKNSFGPPNDTSSYICRMPITGRTPGETIFIRVSTASFNAPGFGIVSDSKSYFTIGAFDNTASVMPAVANNANTCNTMQATTIDSASGKLYMWVPLLTTNGNIIGEVHPAGSPLGTITGGVYVNSSTLRSTNGVAYLDRNFTITPSALQLKQSFSKVWVRLYAKQTEVNTYNAAANDATLGNYKINKNTDDCSATFINPGNAVLNVTDSGRYSNDYFLTAATTAFSSFYLYKGGLGLPLPLKLISFKVVLQNKNPFLSWVTSKEVNVSHFEIERSTNGIQFTTVASVASQAGSVDKAYRFTDVAALDGINYYRLKMIDRDGKFSYSYIIKIDAGKKYSISIIPNPVKNYFIIKGAEGFSGISIIDATGRIVKQMKSNNSGRYETTGLAKGVYLVRLLNDKEFTALTIVIE